ncbi:peptidoglycan-binding protein [Streptomyces sp. NPDC051677]|uniref:peptidoglycan-binding protein n=1 Tax=Streptomyces sp. NPDC051677 TaxID=3365669 RepID=UPI0037CFC799
MIDPTGQQGRPGQRGLPCPECGALRAPDNTPSCSCAQRAADSLRDTRTAEAAAAEDFDPLRIRPYVELEGEQPSAPGAMGTAGGTAGGTARGMAGGTAGGTVRGTAGGMAGGTTGGTAGGTVRGTAGGMAGGTTGGAVSPDGELTMPLPAVPADATMPLRAAEPTGPAPFTLSAPSAVEPRAGDLSLFEAGDAGAAVPDDEEPPSPRRRRTLLVATAAAVVAVVAAAGFASGLFSYDKPTRDGAAPKDVRAAVPAPSTSAASGTPSASASASPSHSDAPASPSERESPTPSAPEESASPSASPSAAASQATPTARVSASAGPDKGADHSEPISEGAVLRRGDTGAEVTELQLRLRQLFLYSGEADGAFGSEVEEALRNYQWSRATTSDGMGVYGAATRAKLESETKEP